MKNSFTNRIRRTVSTNSLYRNDVQKAREFAESVLQTCEIKRIQASIHHLLGNSYLFEDYEKAMYYLNKAKALYGLNTDNIDNSINFTQIYWDKPPQYLNLNSHKSSDLHDTAFYYIKNNRMDEAEKILKLIPQNELHNRGKAFHDYYRGLLYNDSKFFLKSVISFKSSGDKFYLQLPLSELRKYNYEDSILSAISI